MELFERFYVQDEVNPWFEFNAWVKKCMESWILVNDIPGFNPTTNEKNIINEYFAYAADWAYRTYLHRTGYRGINLVSWSFNANNGFNSFFNPNSKRTNPFLEDINGNPYNEYQVSQVMSLQNTAWDWIDVIDIYGVHYNVTLYKDWVKKAWEYYFIANIYPDGINQELYRGYYRASDVFRYANWGMFYTPVTLASLTKIAHAWATAVENGVEGTSDAGWFYDFTTTKGLEHPDIYDSNYCCAPTGDGTPKGLRIALVAHARFLAQGSPQSNSTEWGHSSNHGRRYYNNQQLLTGNNNYQFTNPFALANCWYNDPILERAYKRQGEFSHIPSSGGQSMGAYSNHEGTLYKWGPDWEFWRNMEPYMYGNPSPQNQIPDITLNQGSLVTINGNTKYYEVYIDQNDVFNLDVADIDDSEDGTSTVAHSQIKRLSNDAIVGSIDTFIVDTYEVFYTHTDTGGEVVNAYLYVHVQSVGNQCPVINVDDGDAEPLTQRITWGNAWVRPSTLEAIDAEDGDISVNLLETPLDGGNLIINGVVSDEETEVGTYRVRYSTTDSDGCYQEVIYTIVVEPTVVCPTGITPEPGPIVMFVGQKRTTNPTIIPGNTTYDNFNVESMNTARAIVNDEQEVIAVSPGTVQIRQYVNHCGTEYEGFTTYNIVDPQQFATSIAYNIYLKLLNL